MKINLKVLRAPLLSLFLAAAFPALAREDTPSCPASRRENSSEHHVPGEFSPPHILHHLQLSETQEDQDCLYCVCVFWK